MTIEMSKSQLLASIDSKRKEMIDTARTGGYTCESAVQCSQELDMLLNKYQQILFEEENRTNPPFLQFIESMKKWTARDGLTI
ncbi:aspartyl-phosphate phosphatase Spo0E family protein [Metabacillus idriensis]|uniref:aspartyl-phosphate phosphatase Spo0E family protein n=1 Tax=Metabacillus idriensis TaxID=324768 RepID=UPI00281340AD|nr:aspartyl-phosphate phosphatase Spo0E family protein [Metabacillus idriensis]MDR0136972.1 aspartyl-phosphate phosphatase Spo0E family protein [Metabacillus idriensis]